MKKFYVCFDNAVASAWIEEVDVEAGDSLPSTGAYTSEWGSYPTLEEAQSVLTILRGYFADKDFVPPTSAIYLVDRVEAWRWKSLVLAEKPVTIGLNAFISVKDEHP